MITEIQKPFNKVSGFFGYWKDNDDSSTEIFDLDTCETCGLVVLAANHLRGKASEIWKYRKLGMVEWKDELPPEQAWNDTTEKCDCDGCRP